MFPEQRTAVVVQFSESSSRTVRTTLLQPGQRGYIAPVATVDTIFQYYRTQRPSSNQLSVRWECPDSVTHLNNGSFLRAPRHVAARKHHHKHLKLEGRRWPCLPRSVRKAVDAPCRIPIIRRYEAGENTPKEGRTVTLLCGTIVAPGKTSCNSDVC